MVKKIDKKTNKEQYKEITKKHEILGIIISVLIISTAFFLYDYFTSNTVSEQLDASIEEIAPGEIKDFPSSEAGTFEGWIKTSGFPPSSLRCSLEYQHRK